MKIKNIKMKTDLNSQINVNQIGLRSISYLKTSFHKLNNSKDISPTKKPNPRPGYFKQSPPTYISNNTSSIKEKTRSNPFESSNNTPNAIDIFQNDSFGDSKGYNPGDNKGDHLNSNGNANYFSMSIDPRIDYVLKSLDLVSLTEVFYNYNMNFNDILFLNRDDCNELGLNMVQRNRLLKFCEAFQYDGKDYSYDEVVQFFKKKKKYLIKSRDEDEYQTTAYFANHQTSTSSRYVGNGFSSYCPEDLLNNPPKSNVYTNEVFSPPEHEAIWSSKKMESQRLNSRSLLPQDKKQQNGRASKRGNTHNYEENLSMNTFNQIEHSTELQFSSSVCNVNGIAHSKNKSSRRHSSQSHLISSYHKMTQEIEQYMSNYVSNKRQEQLDSTKQSSHHYAGMHTKSNNSKKKRSNCYLNSVGQLDTANSSQCYHAKQSQSSPLQQSEARTFDFSKSTQNNQSNANPLHRLHRNDNQTLSQKFNKSSSSVDILTDCFKRKENLKNSLIDCNNKIHQSKKLLKILEDNQ